MLTFSLTELCDCPNPCEECCRCFSVCGDEYGALPTALAVTVTSDDCDSGPGTCSASGSANLSWDSENERYELESAWDVGCNIVIDDMRVTCGSGVLAMEARATVNGTPVFGGSFFPVGSTSADCSPPEFTFETLDEAPWSPGPCTLTFTVTL